MKHALVYSRVSTEEQAQGGHHSLDAQKSTCTKLAKDLDYKIVQIFEDPGKSATNMNRPSLQDMLIRCQDDKSIEAVFVQDTDRLARNTNDHLTIKALLKKVDVKVISASQPSIDDTAEGNMIDTIIASVNQFQSDLTSRKTLKGLEEKVRNGGWPLAAPVGYKNVTDKHQNNIIGVDEVMEPLVREAFRTYATGSHSALQVANMLYKKGFRSKRGLRMQNSKIIGLLKNRFYIGEVCWRGIKVKGKHKPLIDERTFDAVQTIMTEHNRHANRSRKHNHLLSGFLYCAICGHRFTGESHPEKKAKYYHCTKRIGHKEKYTKMDYLEELVQERFKDLQFSQKFIEMIVQRVKHRFSEKKEEIEKNRKTLFNQMKGVEQRRDVAEQKLFNGVISDDDFERNRKKFKEQLESIQDQIYKLEKVREIRINEVQEVLKLGRNIFKAYKEAHPLLKKHYLGLFWERFDIKNSEIVKAIPSRIFKAIQDDFKASQIAHKPVFVRRASVLRGDCHPIQSTLNPVGVQIRSEWGGYRDLNPS
ncbi:recombinase family protein [Patescibacteria group bacterium]|nr:recombinase family protein [Patescibacteria group bacterium]